ncbi:uncharacterized protein LOC117104662 isoform X2 [Anneissia japonica]|uniref:uncharacterized protein LOC117104662 isoform X2 n=1 Tax=Anneissia japonica TaxID=1529436 RepID=UPI001425B3C2|nr:uncharacterized protein LOC117104662 isoform X2 [Anneissia japonica]
MTSFRKRAFQKANDAFECFTCKANSSEECQLEGKPQFCDKGTNRCFTETRYHGGTYKIKKIVKNCILEPSCYRKNRKEQTNCEQKEKDFDCFECCDKELCNKDAGTAQLLSSHIITLAMLFFAILFPLHVVR